MMRTEPYGQSQELLLPLPQLSAAGRARQAAAARSPAPALSLEQVSNMLWAGFGLSCHGSGGRAVVGRQGSRAVAVYVCLRGACYRYDACDHALVPVSPKQALLQPESRGPLTVPAITLVYVTDEGEAADTWEETGRIAADDVATVAGNVAAYSTAAGLVARKEDRLARHLVPLIGLHRGQRIALAQTVTAHPIPTH
jgi:hypothetical protein